MNPTHSKVYLMQHYVIQFVSDGIPLIAMCTWYNIMWFCLSVTESPDGKVYLMQHYVIVCQWRNPAHNKVYLIQHYVIKFVSDWILWWQGVLDTTLCDNICQWLAARWWFSPVSFTNQTYRHDITEIVLKVVLNTILLIPSQ